MLREKERRQLLVNLEVAIAGQSESTILLLEKTLLREIGNGTLEAIHDIDAKLVLKVLFFDTASLQLQNHLPDQLFFIA